MYFIHIKIQVLNFNILMSIHTILSKYHDAIAKSVPENSFHYAEKDNLFGHCPARNKSQNGHSPIN